MFLTKMSAANAAAIALGNSNAAGFGYIDSSTDIPMYIPVGGGTPIKLGQAVAPYQSTIAAGVNLPIAMKGWMYEFSSDGLAGIDGPEVEQGHVLICIADNTAAGPWTTKGANFDIVEGNLLPVSDNSIYVDAEYTGTRHDGQKTSPYLTIAAALTAMGTLTYGKIIVVSSQTAHAAEVLVINKDITSLVIEGQSKSGRNIQVASISYGTILNTLTYCQIKNIDATLIDVQLTATTAGIHPLSKGLYIDNCTPTTLTVTGLDAVIVSNSIITTFNALNIRDLQVEGQSTISVFNPTSDATLVKGDAFVAVIGTISNSIIYSQVNVATDLLDLTYMNCMLGASVALTTLTGSCDFGYMSCIVQYTGIAIAATAVLVNYNSFVNSTLTITPGGTYTRSMPLPYFNAPPPDVADNAAALAAGLVAGDLYTVTGDATKILHLVV